MDGFINLLKPPGMTSHDAVGFVRRITKTKKVGHAGTLDPGAAGVLPIAVGKATRLIEYLDAVGKSYRGELTFGCATDSGDDTGKVIESLEDFVVPETSVINKVLAEYTGKITQVPPAHSAIKINGKRACDLIRQGIAVEIPSREVTIHRLEMLYKDDHKLLLDTDCSKGTYIRTLCTDIGASLGIPATMSFLVRTAVGQFKLEDSWSFEELKALQEADELAKCMLPPDSVLEHIPTYQLVEQRIGAFCNGLLTHDVQYKEREKLTENILLRVYSAGEFLGMGHYDVQESAIIPDKVIATR